MIKKLNIILVVAVVAMLALKGLKEIKRTRDRQQKGHESPQSVQQDTSLLAPHVCYAYWAGYSVENPISNRNGILLDTLKAIFPNATFQRVYGDVEEFIKILRENPKAVVVGFGAHPAMKNLPVAPTPLAYCPIVLITLRSNPWQYKDASSLESLRILVNEEFLDSKVLQNLLARHGKDSKHLQVVPASVSMLELAERVEKGEADAFVTTGLNDAAGALMDGIASVRLLQQFRKSKVIGSDGTFLYVSSVDEDFSRRVIEEYEKGIHRIDSNGQRQRIFDYYRIPCKPLTSK